MKNINEMKLKKTQKIYLSPYNNLTQKLYGELVNKGIVPQGYIDNFKIGNSIFSSARVESLEYDYIIIDSPNYWYELYKLFPIEKILIMKNNLVIRLDSYIDSFNYQSYDILFYPHNKAHLLNMIPIIQKLNEYNISVAVVVSDFNYDYLIAEASIKKISVDIVLLDLVKYKCFICFNDWYEFGPILTKLSKERNKITIGIVEGITDFTDSDYTSTREVYTNVDYVLATGENDLKYLTNKQAYIIGIPKIYNILKEKVVFPKLDVVVINLSFVALSYNEDRISWLDDVISVCNLLDINYIISQHPKDDGNLESYKNVQQLNIYECIKLGTIVISRFSTVILESLAYGKPVVYFKPKKERNKLFDNNNCFSIANNKVELKEKIIYEMSRKDSTRQRSNLFLHQQCNVNSRQEPSVLATNYIKSVLK